MKVRTGGDGYWAVPTPAGYKGSTLINGRYVYEHRLIAERKIGRLLRDDEVVHHKNEDRLDNRPENLEVMSRSEHATLHNRTGITMVRLSCPVCAGEFVREKRQTFLSKPGYDLTTCSRSCSGKVTHMDRDYLITSQEILEVFVSLN